ncbi:hypothetical protein J3R83DRAFT_2460, partial [Lanmaoa asiatica]
QQKKVNPIEINGRSRIYSVAFLTNGRHAVGSSDDGEIRRWGAEDGGAVGTPMNAGSIVFNIAVSRDEKWVVGGTETGEVTVWNAENHQRTSEFQGHQKRVCAVDVSPDATRIATGSGDDTACVWSLSTGERLLGPLKHDNFVVGVKFSPHGHLIATATWRSDSLRIYDTRSGDLLVDVPIRVNSYFNGSLAWAGDSNQLFALSRDGSINCLDVSTGATLSKWPIHSNKDPTCIALDSNGTFIAASANSSVSFWDTTTHEQIGSVIHYTADVRSMAISENYDIVVGGGKTITLRNICKVLPSPYFSVVSTSASNAYSLRLAARSCPGEGQPHQVPSNAGDEFECVHRRSDSCFIDIIRVHEDSKIDHLEKTVQHLFSQHANSEHRADGLVQVLCAHEQIHRCETLYAEGRIIDAAVSLLEITNTASEEVRDNKLIMDRLTGESPQHALWYSIQSPSPEFTNQCISTLELTADEALSAEKQDEAVAAYSTALLLNPSTPNTLLSKWASTALARGSVNEALCAAAKFTLPRFDVYRAICDILEEDGRVTEAIECFRRMQRELGEDTGSCDEQAQWELDFNTRCLKALEQRGDLAMDSTSYAAAAVHYTTALTLDPFSADLLTKRSKARAGIGLWKDSLEDADAAIKLNPSSPCGYERRHAALLGAHCYDEAINAYSDMLLRLEQSPDPVTRGSRNRYLSPSQTVTAIRSSVKRTQRDAPLVLINTETGCLCDKHKRVDEFEADPKFKGLVSSMTTALDDSRITQTVQGYFRYATFSHTWEGAEPLFHDVLHKPVHELAASPTVWKLVMFCTTVREAGLRWAWCDTCCINKTDSSVLQESLTSMFQWYHDSSLTIVHLKGVLSDSELDALERSLWNTRAWTLQEFFASRVIRFYTEDWKPYLPWENVYNHKDSSTIMGEMAAANGIDVQALLSLRPGSENVRQKLCLAAKRIATKPEDIAYSLFGIFDVSIPVTYGEGQQRALGRLLQEILTRSGDVTILAWTGKASDYNSCLPAEIGVYREPASPYVPSLIEDRNMDPEVAELWTSSGYLDSAVKLYDLVVTVPSPRLVSRRLSLTCIMFPLRGQSVVSSGSPCVYRAVTSALGNVEIKTTEDLSSLANLVLVHPWLKCLLDPALPSEDPVVDDNIEPLTPLDGNGSSDALLTNAPSSSSSHTISPPHHSSQLDKATRALRLFVRLRQPFGALLLVPLSHNEYKRVASDHLIVVQLLEDVSPRYLAQKIRTLDIL